MRIIVAIDIIGGKCVRLTRGDFDSRKVYSEDPLDMAKRTEDSGIRFLHLVDLDGAREKKPVNLRVLEKIAGRTNLTIDFGGGIRTSDDLRMVFNAGAAQVTGGSIAVTNAELFLQWLREYGAERLILGADHRNGKISTAGWMDDSELELIGFLKEYIDKGIRYTVCTDIERDGMLKGPSTAMYRKILEEVNVNLIASGGISSLSDIDEVAAAGCEGVIIGKAVYEGRIALKDLGKLC